MGHGTYQKWCTDCEIEGNQEIKNWVVQQYRVQVKPIGEEITGKSHGLTSVGQHNRQGQTNRLSPPATITPPQRSLLPLLRRKRSKQAKNNRTAH